MRSAPRRRFNGVRSHLYPSYKAPKPSRSEEHTSELQSRLHLVCRLLLEKKKFKYLVSYAHKPSLRLASITPRTFTPPKPISPAVAAPRPARFGTSPRLTAISQANTVPP